MSRTSNVRLARACVPLLMLLAAPIRSARSQGVAILKSIEVGPVITASHVFSSGLQPISRSLRIAFANCQSRWGADFSVGYGQARPVSDTMSKEVSGELLLSRRLTGGNGKLGTGGAYVGVGVRSTLLNVTDSTNGPTTYGVAISGGYRISISRYAVIRSEVMLASDKSVRSAGVRFNGTRRLELRLIVALTSPINW